MTFNMLYVSPLLSVDKPLQLHLSVHKTLLAIVAGMLDLSDETFFCVWHWQDSILKTLEITGIGTGGIEPTIALL
jgi:hypothetical protein